MQILIYLEPSTSLKSYDFWRFYSVFRKINMAFLSSLWVQQKTLKNKLFFSENPYKISKNCPIFKKLTVPSRQKFAIFKKNPAFLNLGKSLWPRGVIEHFFVLCYPHIKHRKTAFNKAWDKIIYITNT